MATVASRAAESFVIEGGRALNGTIRAAGNKNGALPIVAACLLTDEPVRLTNVPHIRDVETMMELIADLGAAVDWTATNEVSVHAASLDSHELDAELASRIRASFLLASSGPARRNEARIRLASSASSLRAGFAPRSFSRARCSRASAVQSCRR